MAVPLFYYILTAIGAALYMLHRATRTRNPSIPGPKPLPFIGNLLDAIPLIHRPALFLFQVGKKYGPVARVTLPGKDIVVISDPVLARQVLRGHNGTIGKDDLFQQAMTGIARYGLFALPDNDMYTRHRKKLQPAFSPINLQRGLEIANLCAKELLTVFKDKMAKGENGFDMYHGLTSAVADVIGRLAFSYEFGNIQNMARPGAVNETYEQLETLLKFMHQRVFGAPKPLWKIAGLGQDKVDPVGAKVKATVMGVIEERKKANIKRSEKEMDVLDRLLAKDASGEQTFTMDETTDEIVAFYMAGQDAMANGLVWTFFALCNNPIYQEKCVEEIARVVKDPSGAPTYEELAELKFVEACFKEATRIHTVLGAIPPRHALQTMVLGGYTIEQGTDVIVSADLIHHDPKVWGPDVEEYKPERWEKEQEGFFGFSDGTHMCIGYRLAYLQAKAFLCAFMRQYRFTIVPGQDLEPEEAISLGLRKGLKVDFEPRK